MCAQCAALQARLIMAQSEIVQLRNEVTRLNRVIAAAAATAATIQTEADRATRGGVSKGQWAYHQGRRDAAGRIIQSLTR